jgi:hypothetical protein
LLGLRADVDSHIGSLTLNPALRGLTHGEANSFIIVAQATAACIIRDSTRAPVLNNTDPLAKFLLASRTCPSNMFDLRSQLLAAGATIKTTLVANRGFHNPKTNHEPIHFMLFEIVSGRLGSLGIDVKDGEFFFGHFTTIRGANTLAADQRPDPDALMVELIAWDPGKQVFNFYELMGNGQKGEWFYRGDSLDIQADVTFLHRSPDPGQPKFGSRLRCSGCHIAGGPIMKELAAPHNDWWTTERPLPLGKLKPDADLARIFQSFVDASELAESVKVGLSMLAQSDKIRRTSQTPSLQEQLRPLFCPVELNLESDPTPLDKNIPTIEIPSAFVVHPLLARSSLTAQRDHYDAALATMKASFPETTRADADHAWLTPVKAFSDTLAIESLIKQNIIDEEFASDVLAVDLANPLFSTERCHLLSMVPIKMDGDWKDAFKTSLQAQAGKDQAAQELFTNLDDSSRNTQFHRARAVHLLNQCQNRLQTSEGVLTMYRLLAQRREEVNTSEISQNGDNKILEPGFRVIFPKVTPAAKPGALVLTEDCLVRAP